jgi:hypothetical protein
MCRQLIWEHKKYYRYISPYTRKLEKLIVDAGSPLPAEPPLRWDVPGEDLFEPKPLPYPPLNDEDDELEERVHEVERVLQMRIDDEGRKEYYVKWKHSSSSENSWVKAKDILSCQDLIDEFEATEQQQKKKSGHKKN